MSKIIIPVSFVKLVVTALWFSLFLAEEGKSLLKSLLSEGRYFWHLLTPMKFYPLFSGRRYFRNLTVVDLPVKLKGNSKRISAKLLSPLWAKNKDLGEETLLTYRGFITSATQGIYIKSCKKYTLSSSGSKWKFGSLQFSYFWIGAKKMFKCMSRGSAGTVLK